MTDYAAVYAMRAKIIGVLLRDVRQSAGKTARECAELIGCSTGLYNAYENGLKSPSLPELEVLAFFLNTPLKHFWGNVAQSEKPRGQAAGDFSVAVTHLRDRILGAQLRKARVAAKIKLKEFAAQLQLSSGRLSAYEFGQKPIPLPELEAITQALHLNIEDLFESQGTVGEWENAQVTFDRFKQLDVELRDFVTNPANETYLHLAKRLSQMPAGQLRGIAESLLEITY